MNISDQFLQILAKNIKLNFKSKPKNQNQFKKSNKRNTFKQRKSPNSNKQQNKLQAGQISTVFSQITKQQPFVTDQYQIIEKFQLFNKKLQKQQKQILENSNRSKIKTTQRYKQQNKGYKSIKQEQHQIYKKLNNSIDKTNQKSQNNKGNKRSDIQKKLNGLISELNYQNIKKINNSDIAKKTVRKSQTQSDSSDQYIYSQHRLNNHVQIKPRINLTMNQKVFKSQNKNNQKIMQENTLFFENYDIPKINQIHNKHQIKLNQIQKMTTNQTKLSQNQRNEDQFLKEITSCFIQKGSNYAYAKRKMANFKFSPGDYNNSLTNMFRKFIRQLQNLIIKVYRIQIRKINTFQFNQLRKDLIKVHTRFYSKDKDIFFKILAHSVGIYNFNLQQGEVLRLYQKIKELLKKCKMIAQQKLQNKKDSKIQKKYYKKIDLIQELTKDIN